jgi:hypothetical protein
MSTRLAAVRRVPAGKGGASVPGIDAVVVLPDGDDDYPLRWRNIKHFVSIGMDAGSKRASLARRCEKGIW